MSDDVKDYWIEHAIDVIYATYGDVVSVEKKRKDLIKYGRSEQVGTSTQVTLMTLPTGTLNETYVSDNLITKFSSSSDSDTGIISYEGHTVDGSGNFTFFTDSFTAQGQTQVTLPTAGARVTRAYSDDANDLVGNCYFYETDTETSGVPDTAAKIHCMIRAGQNQTEKASTTISQYDYWIVTGVYGDVLQKTAASAEIALEVRQKGKVFRKQFDYSASNSSGEERAGPPYAIIPKNSDVRLRAIASGANTIVSGGIFGVLATIASKSP